MTAVVIQPDIRQKLEILSGDARYDLACACGSTEEEHRRRSADGQWIYPVTLPDGRRGSLLKVLMSNVCVNDCAYCPLRAQQDVRRCSLQPEELAQVFWDYYTAGRVFGLFISSGVCGLPDAAMERMLATASILRRQYQFKGYIHLKILPGASYAAIQQAVQLASAVSLNIEVPGASYLNKLTRRKDFMQDIIQRLQWISHLAEQPQPTRRRVCHTTQFIVGAAGETDRQIVRYMDALYRRLKVHRVYFSAYQNPNADGWFDAQVSQQAHRLLVREHRLYQADFLVRKFGFCGDEIPVDDSGNLPVAVDPKQAWADQHPEFFPVAVNSADRWQLLRVPGFGVRTVDTILKRRQQARLTGIEQIGPLNHRLLKAARYVVF